MYFFSIRIMLIIVIAVYARSNSWLNIYQASNLILYSQFVVV